MLRTSRSRLTIVFVVAWAVAIITGVGLINSYELKAALTGPMTHRWPVSSSLQAVPGVATLIMALHPKCPCSETSLSELQGVLEHQHARINVHLLVYQPKGYPTDWAMTDLVRRAQNTKGLDVLFDKDGQELSKFHARVSGELWYYDGTGQLVFRGGITAGRGHAGRNTGMSSLIALLDGKPPLAQETPVFGCAIGAEVYNENVLGK